METINGVVSYIDGRGLKWTLYIMQLKYVPH